MKTIGRFGKQMKQTIDLHIHTNASDGKLSPEQVIEEAIRCKLKAIAITDHDTLDGVKNVIDYVNSKDIEFIPGIEISCYEDGLGFTEVHIIGLFINYKNNKLNQFINKIKQDRINQKKETIKKLNEFGFDINFEEVNKTVGSSFGRPHIAQFLLKKYPKRFSSIRDVFDKYLEIGKPAYVDRIKKTKMREAIDIIKDAGGISFLAHPGIHKKSSLKLIKIFKKFDGKGIETFYPYNIIYPELKIDKKENLKLIEFYRKIAKSMNLLETGGSDFHGEIRDSKIGELFIPYSLLENMKNKLEILFNNK